MAKYGSCVCSVKHAHTVMSDLSVNQSNELVLFLLLFDLYPRKVWKFLVQNMWEPCRWNFKYLLIFYVCRQVCP